MIKWMIASSCLILMILVIRQIFRRKISARLQYALWFFVAVRLLIPVNIGNSVLSIENFINQLTTQRQENQIDGNIEASEYVSNAFDPIKVYESIEEVNISENTSVSLNEISGLSIAEKAFKFDVFEILFGVWVLGAVVVATIFIISNIVFGQRLKTQRTRLNNANEKLPIYVSSEVETPCLFGLIQPGIYVTNQVIEDENILRHAVMHEVTHYEQGDLVWAVIRCLCLSLHWYNPLVWWAAKLSQQDAEIACDEATIRKLGEEERAAYGKTLIQLTCEKRHDLLVSATTMTTDKKSIKNRIQRIAKKPKLSFATFFAVLMVCCVGVGCTFTGAENKIEPIESEIISEKIENEMNILEEQIEDSVSNAEKIIAKVNEKTGSEYKDANLLYVDHAEVGWDYYSDNPWSSDAERDELAQAALKELYLLTGYNVTECTYTTDGRSRFIFGKDADYIRKCIAFYSRDFGFTLCGDSVPYQGYMNARKFHYSDVQQLITPLKDESLELEGGLSKWYLEHSGVYQGEKIIGHEEINQDDTVYVHTKLLFEGGYYIVVIEKKLGSVDEIEGPYYSNHLTLADSWAKAFIAKDVESIIKFSTDKACQQMIDYQLMDEDNLMFGWSSPWPELFTEEGYKIIKCDNSGAEILYYASLSTPHVVVWKETLAFENGQISAWDLQCYDNISSYDEYMNAYPGHQIANTTMDYYTNGLGEILNENALLSSSKAYESLFDAATAALDLLNISRSFEIEHYDIEETKDGAIVSIPFLNRDGSVERVMVTMWQPYGENGIWIPK